MKKKIEFTKIEDMEWIQMIEYLSGRFLFCLGRGESIKDIMSDNYRIIMQWQNAQNFKCDKCKK